MPHLDKQSAKAILDPILEKIQTCIQESWDEWTAFYAPKHHILDARARAAIVYCHTVDRAMELFRGVGNVTTGRKRGVFRLFIGDDIALRFKKAKRNGTTSNVSTLQQKLIDMQLTIPGILPGTMLNATYQLDDLQQDISRMMVTHQLQGRVVWSIELKAADPMPMPMPKPKGSPAPAPARARIKGARKDKKSSTAE